MTGIRDPRPNGLEPALMLALRMLFHNRIRLAMTATGLGVAFFLAAAQFGLLVGWINTTSAIVRNSGADIWVMAQKTPAFDFGTAIPRTRVYQLRSVPGVEWAEGLFQAFNVWQCPDGRRLTVELIGLDRRCVGGPWRMKVGDPQKLRQVREGVIVDELFLGTLGVQGVGQDVEMIGQRARIIGLSQRVRTFTASPIVFTSIQAAIRYDQRYAADEVTYAVAKCRAGHSPQSVRDAARKLVRNVEVLTTDEMAARTVKYWMLETGVGITVVITATLGILVGAVITSQTLFATTQENLPHYATLLALGFSRLTLVAVVLGQSVAVGLAGILLGSAFYFPASLASARTPIPLETTAPIFTALAAVSLIACIAASFLSIRTIFAVDPVVVFRQ